MGETTLQRLRPSHHMPSRFSSGEIGTRKMPAQLAYLPKRTGRHSRLQETPLILWDCTENFQSSLQLRITPCDFVGWADCSWLVWDHAKALEVIAGGRIEPPAKGELEAAEIWEDFLDRRDHAGGRGAADQRGPAGLLDGMTKNLSVGASVFIA